MCGLAALFAYNPSAAPVDAVELNAINNAMIRRGPDGGDSWISDDGRVGLAHRRLAIIDLSDGGHQPMATEDGRLRITFNGEIYNYRALKQELIAKGYRFRSDSDTEVLLNLYRAEGRDMVKRLRGMFAFALWDADRQGVLLARDPYGIKPLYMADDGHTLRVASQVKALKAGGVAGNGINPAGHVGFFLFGHVPDPHTLYADIKALPAGTTFWQDRNGGRRTERFFDVAETLANARDAKAVDLGEALRDTVKHHFVADVPVGAFLSSGLDSTTLVGLASEIRGADLDTMTLGFEEFRGTPKDEAPLAEDVAKLYGTRHRTRWVEGEKFSDALDDILDVMDQPSIDGVNVYFVAREARQMGLKVALSGLGGDELFGGYDTFRQVPQLVGALGWMPGLRFLGAGLRMVSAPLCKHFTSPKAAGLLEYGTRYEDAYLLRRGLMMPWELSSVLDPDLAREGWRQLMPHLRIRNTHRAIGEPQRKIAALEASWYMRNQLLRDADWAGMAHSLEIRVPFVDAWLLKALAPVMGRAGGPDKRAMALTPSTPLPDAVLNRPKTGFSVPVHDWLQKEGGAQGRGLRGWAKTVYDAF